ncbi:hypothetical protein, partial [Mesomycoplasma ovipneumoniae]|uniref:hypothetical protein n=1 Tax=Mesomycoplasma ovipneumoniae TaxID=29562 RepID=UPI003080869E
RFWSNFSVILLFFSSSCCLFVVDVLELFNNNWEVFTSTLYKSRESANFKMLELISLISETNFFESASVLISETKFGLN